MASSLHQAKQYEEAIRAYYQALEFNEVTPIWVYQGLGNLLIQQQHWHEAILICQQALMIESNNAKILQQLKTAQKLSSN